jgi:hypothetical protein
MYTVSAASMARRAPTVSFPLVPPDEHVGIQQQVHREPSKSRITASGKGASKSLPTPHFTCL